MAKNILGLCGSLRKDSWNLKLLRNFLAQAKQEGGFSAELGPSLDLPLFNEELESRPLPQAVVDFRAAVKAADVIALGSPEYNASFSGALKNAIDWCSRPPENLWAGKVVVLLSGSPGSLGGARGLIQLRTVVSNLKSWVIHEQVQSAFTDKAFDSEGRLTDEGVKKQMHHAIEALKSSKLLH